ncbi:MAG TPA: urocanate hydratase [Bacillota bacterium]|jgi:urocanate hydratase|nr:urocanate hydratase [Fastidiosipila sp.]HPX93589.1 urocanate hydratase [Bacillota bacterium]HQB80564.1 urocanate hydratase [Bacillota bacterium]
MDRYETESCHHITLDGPLPPDPVFEAGIRRAPRREARLSEKERAIALKNALRYIPVQHHEIMASEFLRELDRHGKIYGYRYRPQGRLFGKPIDQYKGNCIEGKAFQVMIDNNLDFEVALYPYELITYGETGAVCQNWMQYRLIKQYLEILTDEQTLVLFSGHPVGLFHSPRSAPRVILTNGLMIGQYDNLEDYNRASSMGVSSYGQMTAGGWMYIGPQGIVHGTYNTLLNAGRQELGIPNEGNLAGRLFVSSGLGGMSGAQGKACKIAGGVAIIAEVDPSRIKTRHEQGWVDVIADSCEKAFSTAAEAMAEKEALAIAYHGNIVDLLEFAIDRMIPIELLSDQTSCHEPYTGGYCPQGLTYDERTAMLAEDPDRFREYVNRSLAAHYRAIKTLTERGTYFFDYGNSFMKAVFDSGVREISKNGENDRDGFIWPSYVEDIMGPLLFDYGYGPFRWVCLSGKDEDLRLTDQAAMSCIDPERRYQDRDNYNWIRDAEKNKLVVGTKARILYSDALGRMEIALKMNELVRQGKIGPVMIGRDHHDTGGTDSPFRETSNIYDGSNVTADMATSVFAGNAARGMSLCALHNGGGTGIGKAINGGFGCVLDGSERIDQVLRNAVLWDVMAGVARRAWARSRNAIETAEEYNRIMKGKDYLTLPYLADDQLIQKTLREG